MIHTSKQLKDKVRNISKGDNDVADTTVKALPLNENDAERIISEICAIPLEDGVTFSITSVTSIMTDFEYPGIRMML